MDDGGVGEVNWGESAEVSGDRSRLSTKQIGHKFNGHYRFPTTTGDNQQRTGPDPVLWLSVFMDPIAQTTTNREICRGILGRQSEELLGWERVSAICHKCAASTLIDGTRTDHV